MNSCLQPIFDTLPGRYERKFRISSCSHHAIRASIYSHPAGFSEIYYLRCINNIYYDTPALTAYYENMDGIGTRIKTRIRWYGDDAEETTTPTLEFKYKQGLVGKKLSYTLPSIRAEALLSSPLTTICSQHNLPEKLSPIVATLKPILINSYKRSYHQSADKAFRVTLDTNLTYQRPNVATFKMHSMKECGISILELKYAIDHDATAPQIALNIPFPATKNSKFISGMHMLYA